MATDDGVGLCRSIEDADNNATTKTWMLFNDSENRESREQNNGHTPTTPTETFVKGADRGDEEGGKGEGEGTLFWLPKELYAEQKRTACGGMQRYA